MTSAFLCKFMKTIINLQKTPFAFRRLYTRTDDFYTDPVFTNTYMTDFL